MKLVNDLQPDFAHGTKLGADEHVGLAVERLADGQEGADSRQRIGVLEQRSVIVLAHSLVNRLRLSAQTDEQGVGFQQREIILIRDKTSACGNHRAGSRGQGQGSHALAFAKSRFALLAENLRDSPTCGLFHEHVRIHELEFQMLGDKLANNGFARAHKANEGQVVDVTRDAHKD